MPDFKVRAGLRMLLSKIKKAASGREELWIAFWVWGISFQLVFVGLYFLAEYLRYINDIGVGRVVNPHIVVAGGLRYASEFGADFLDALKLLVFSCWAAVAWRCSKNVGAAWWTTAARAAIVVSVGLVAITI